jgi:hypothetical protein
MLVAAPDPVTDEAATDEAAQRRANLPDIVALKTTCLVLAAWLESTVCAAGATGFTEAAPEGAVTPRVASTPIAPIDTTFRTRLAGVLILCELTGTLMVFLPISLLS